MSEHERKKVRVIISGKVQMVNFRHETRKTARELGLAGWVRNLRNEEEQVEALFEGRVEKVDEMIEWCRSNEPGGSPGNVSDVVPVPLTDEDCPFPFERRDDRVPDDD